jgi:hypothetical protein
MHPDIARDLISQRTSEMRALASRDAMAKAAARNRRDRRAAARAQRDVLAAGEIPAPRVSDRVDGVLHEDGVLCGAADRAHADA